MTVADPFATAADEAQAEPQPEVAPTESVFDEPPAEAPKKAPAKKAAPKKAVVEDDEDGDFHPFTVSMKPHAGHNSPLFVFRGKSLGDLADQFEGAKASDMIRLFENSVKAANKLTKVYVDAGHVAEKQPSNYGGGGAKSAGGADPTKPPAEAVEPPNGEYKYCKHGQMRFKSFVSKAGKFTQLFECTSEDESNKCNTEFLKDKK